MNSLRLNGLVVFDLDGTLLREKTACELLAVLFQQHEWAIAFEQLASKLLKRNRPFVLLEQDSEQFTRRLLAQQRPIEIENN